MKHRVHVYLGVPFVGLMVQSVVLSGRCVNVRLTRRRAFSAQSWNDVDWREHNPCDWAPESEATAAAALEWHSQSSLSIAKKMTPYLRQY